MNVYRNKDENENEREEMQGRPWSEGPIVRELDSRPALIIASIHRSLHILFHRKID